MSNDGLAPRVAWKEQFDSYMAQADFAWRSFDTRRAYEWKITLGLWTAVGAAIAFFDDAPVHWYLALILAVLVVLLYVCLWLKALWARNCADKERARLFREKAETILKDATTAQGSQQAAEPQSHPQLQSATDVRPTTRYGWSGFFCDWSMLFQTLASIIFLLVAVVTASDARHIFLLDLPDTSTEQWPTALNYVRADQPVTSDIEAEIRGKEHVCRLVEGGGPAMLACVYLADAREIMITRLAVRWPEAELERRYLLRGQWTGYQIGGFVVEHRFGFMTDGTRVMGFSNGHSKWISW